MTDFVQFSCSRRIYFASRLLTGSGGGDRKLGTCYPVLLGDSEDARLGARRSVPVEKLHEGFVVAGITFQEGERG